MRVQLPVLASVFVFAVLALPAAAQDDGCESAHPCSIPAFVDEAGFVDGRDVNATVGDWYVVSVSNPLDERSHTVTLADFGVSITVASGEDKASQPFQLMAAHVGDHLVRDSPSGDTMVFRVLQGDTVDHEAGLDDDTLSSSSKGRAPGVALPLLVAGLAVAALALRRSR
ncbi:MAG: hypothetical protein QOD77_1177 [Thermoplasmata archaeon]|jgi:hypothetical protein|nr:hypothetical protein [Thermoplasmata archaeon]